MNKTNPYDAIIDQCNVKIALASLNYRQGANIKPKGSYLSVDNALF